MKQPNKNLTYEHKGVGTDYVSDPESTHFEDEMVCSKCGALHKNGTWSWEQLPNKIKEGICPACERIQKYQPAGFVTLTGNYLEKNKDHLITFIQSIATSELSEQPLERLMDITRNEKAIIITTTGVNLARRIGYALNLAFQGNLTSTSNGEDHIDIVWHRDNQTS